MQRLICGSIKSLTAVVLAGAALHSPAWAQQAKGPLTYDEYHALAQSIDYEKHTITAEAFLKLRENGAVVLDMRSVQDYQNSHIEGALHIGSADITSERLAELVPDKTQTILIYCTNSLTLSRMMSLTDIALPQFIAQGYPNVFMPSFAGLKDVYSNGTLPMVGD